MDNLSLILFTVFLQASVGVMACVAIGRLVDKNTIFKKAIVTVPVLALIGLAISFFHLGSPLNAMYALLGFGHSWLSREIWFSTIFIGLAILSAGLVLFKPDAKGAITGLTFLAMLIGIAAIYGMGSIYATSSVPFWQHYSTYVGFFVSAIAIGAVLFLAACSQEAGKFGKIVAICVPIILVACASVTMTYYVQLGTQESVAIQTTLSKLNSMKPVIIMQWVFALIGSGLLFIFLNKEKKSNLAIYLASALVIIGLLFGRYIFFAAEVVTRVGLN